MKLSDFDSHLEQLLHELIRATGNHLSAKLTAEIMEVMREYLWAYDLSDNDFTWMFVHTAALGHKFARRLQGIHENDLDGDDLDVLREKLTGSH